MTDRRADLDRFYALLSELEAKCGGKRRLAECTGRMGWPQRGVYFFFEDGELRDDGATPRVVRVGTHALRPSVSTLWGRLAQHRGSGGGTMPGGGNHRGSIFRLHVGTALLASGDWPASIGETWSEGGTAPSSVRMGEYPLEKVVSEYIGSMPFLWLAVDDPPGPASDRGVIEVGSIALLSNLDRPPIDAPSAAWLGRRADREVIRASGLWNVNHVRDFPEATFLDVLSVALREATRHEKRVPDRNGSGLVVAAAPPGARLRARNRENRVAMVTEWRLQKELTAAWYSSGGIDTGDERLLLAAWEVMDNWQINDAHRHWTASVDRLPVP